MIRLPLGLSNGRYNFVFDTGSDFSLINTHKNPQAVTDTTNIFSAISAISTYEDIYTCLHHWKCYDLNINEELLLKKQLFMLNGYKDDYLNLSVDSNFIGMNVIDKFDWLFDMNNNVATVYKKGSRELLSLGKEKIIFKKKIDKNAFFCDITINDSITQEFLFDTGFGKRNSYIGDYKITTDVILSDSLYNYLNYNIPDCINVEVEECDSIGLQLIQSLKIEQTDFQNLSAIRSKENRSNGNIFTLGFIRRFDKMYYDSKKDEVLLFKNDSLNDISNTDKRELIIKIKKLIVKEDKMIDEEEEESFDYYEFVHLMGAYVKIYNDSVGISIDVFKKAIH
ncbi:hypothetical protein D0T85_14265 [Bacteroides sp. 519]|nr:hypothetical protein [Bacteroides sp. 519]